MSDSSTVMRPKSMATVVVRLSGTTATSSMPIDAHVIASSVSSGGISDRALTSVVLPTPKPPATRILRGTGPESACTQALQKAGEDLWGGVAVGRRRGSMDGEVTGRGEVADEHPRHANGHAERRPDLDERHRPCRHGDDRAVLGLELRRRPGGGGDDRLDRQVALRRAGTAAGDGEDGDHASVARTSVARPVARGSVHWPVPVRTPGVSAWPTRLASIVIS